MATCVSRTVVQIISWNVNGLRACFRKGFATWLHQSGAAIVGLQEVRAQEQQLSAELAELSGWHYHLNPAERPGYSGVGLFSRQTADEVITSLGHAPFDIEGRLQLARFGRLWVANVYFPNGNGKDRDNSRIPYKLAFYQHLFSALEPLRAAGESVLVMGDFNTAHQPIDLARPKENEKTSGFRPEERAELDRWLTSGWVDTFRHSNPQPGHYSWWSSRAGARERNVGWRIDYVLASPAVLPRLKQAFIHPHVLGSDHCPVGVEISA